MNTAKIAFEEKQIKQGALDVNGFRVQFGFDGSRKVYQVAQLANDFNMSNRLMFEARTIKRLIGKIEKHTYKLVRH